jgi:hypothetical protein
MTCYRITIQKLALWYGMFYIREIQWSATTDLGSLRQKEGIPVTPDFNIVCLRHNKPRERRQGKIVHVLKDENSRDSV